MFPISECAFVVSYVKLLHTYIDLCVTTYSYAYNKKYSHSQAGTTYKLLLLYLMNSCYNGSIPFRN